jgi:hypothetical protein
MKKIYFLASYLLLASFNGFATDGDSSQSGFNVSKYQAEVQRIKSDVSEIYSHFQIFELSIVEEEFNRFNSEVGRVERILKELNDSEDIDIRNEFYDLFEETMRSYNKLVNLYDFYLQLERKKEIWSNQYFNLWEKTYAYKIRIDQLYVKEEKVNIHYGGMKDAKVTKVRKRNIYEACILIYDQTLSKLKRLNDCDHYGRIELLEELLPVLDRCGKLVLLDGTKELEKQLKRTDDPREKADLIMNYQIEE